MEIKANAKGSRFIQVSEENLDTIRRYSLLNNLVDSSGYVDETTLEKLQQNVRALLDASPEIDKQLLDLCFDVIYHRDMKALGLRNLMLLYISYNENQLDLDGFSPEDLLLEADDEDDGE